MKVFYDGIAGWNLRNPTALSAAALKEAWIDPGRSFILLDARPSAKSPKDGFIPGAVAAPAESLDSLLASFPPKEAKAPVVVYDAGGGGHAENAARRLISAGYAGPRVLAGGYAAWVGAGHPTGRGAPAERVAYAPKPKAGSMSVEEFAALAKEIPRGILVIDARGADEAAARGVVRGAVNIPCERIAERLGEIPKDREIVLYCNTGVMAEMACVILREKGYRARFVDGVVTTDRDGGFTVGR